jgi:hypothetical protein
MLGPMKILRLIQIATAVAATLISTSIVRQAAAATVPAGTHVVVQTTATITSVDAPGTRVHAVLTRPLSSNGKIAVPAGAKVLGRIVTSRRMHSNTRDRLTVDITEISFNGRGHKIRTTGPVFVDNLNWKTTTGATVTRGGYAVRGGRHLQFQLAEPLVF